MPASPFRIKICGITSVEDAQLVVDAGGDALGLNFYPESKRYISDELASEIVDVVHGAISNIGLFVNESAERIAKLVDDLRLGGIQLHGDEPPEFLSTLSHSPLLRARRMDERGLAAIADDLAACRAAGRLPDAVLVDAAAPGQYGGTGQTVSWADLVDFRQTLGEVPLILAGGLTPENVAEAIRTVRPDGVDVASGVESAPGVKDPAKVRKFVEQAKMAFEAV